MGLVCSCGVRTNPSATGNLDMFFVEDSSTRPGSITLAVNACADRLESTTFTATFVDQSNAVDDRNFTFTATSANTRSVSCGFLTVGVCIVTTKGEGLVTGETTPRAYEVSFTTGPPSSNDTLFNLTIAGFASGPVLGSADLQPNLTFFGCNEI
ncbi:hypothetical protein RRV45_05360 [Bacillus sp. DTU_2020_1000418_1_SI_GHA_SEK_038]|uniref:hypothetical protein n=1 Tax=Bacillus sp. DTU_2020_1000418_1_SI_GHA_SEK_038 TaxID=3077585 RepID=UPI0028EB76AA|nr:hypothetical protein [Bacillus sp. DTU_2020_1000418_1_SI_GHA_SEK_038]WNS76439.1 hypothetical protein RRV45_05360 [Bacillus sp. DTU_2020_1000418_1_SI_GHA_SEK_038]